jgi:hypothetical protein
MIIRHKHRGRFAIVPNQIFDDTRLSFTAKGLLAYLLSLPPDWEVRHSQIQRKLGIGRKRLDGAFKELIAAGYAIRDEQQGRDEYNRFTTLNYVVSDVSNRDVSDAPSPRLREPKREKRNGTNKERINKDLTNPFSKSLPSPQVRREQGLQAQYSEIGNRALAAGQWAVFVGSEPYKAWQAFRSDAGMPGFVDKAIIGGNVRDVVWMPSLYPPRHQQSTNSGEDRQ